MTRKSGLVSRPEASSCLGPVPSDSRALASNASKGFDVAAGARSVIFPPSSSFSLLFLFDFYQNHQTAGSLTAHYVCPDRIKSNPEDPRHATTRIPFPSNKPDCSTPIPRISKVHSRSNSKIDFAKSRLSPTGIGTTRSDCLFQFHVRTSGSVVSTL